MEKADSRTTRTRITQAPMTDALSPTGRRIPKEIRRRIRLLMRLSYSRRGSLCSSYFTAFYTTPLFKKLPTEIDPKEVKSKSAINAGCVKLYITLLPRVSHQIKGFIRILLVEDLNQTPIAATPREHTSSLWGFCPTSVHTVRPLPLLF